MGWISPPKRGRELSTVTQLRERERELLATGSSTCTASTGRSTPHIIYDVHVHVAASLPIPVLKSLVGLAYSTMVRCGRDLHK